MPEATLVREASEFRLTSQAAVSVGDLHQLPSGEAGYYLRVAGSTGQPTAGASGQAIDYKTTGKVTLPLTAGITVLSGGRAYWDHSANLVNYKKVNDRDFYIGRFSYSDSGTYSGGLCEVDLNKDPPYDIDLLRDAYLSVPVGTQAIGAFGFPKFLGGALSIELTATNEAQKIDALSVDGFTRTANAIVEIVFRIPDDGAGAAADLSLFVANGTHATDADLIAESIGVHLNANDVNIYLESDDGTTEVAATDSTIDYTEGSAVANRAEVWMDFRTEADVQIYVNGVLALPSTVFNINVAAGPLFLLAHLEKSSSTDVYRAVIDRFCARYSEQ
jgi:hypothetical protein